MLVPVPAAVPPHEPVNHCQEAPVASEPPETVSTLSVPLHVLLLVMVTPVGATESAATLTARVLAVLFPHAFEAYTLTVPPAVPDVTVMVLVSWPETIIHPAGTLHVYDVAPATATTSYVRPDVLAQGAAGPVIAPGCAGTVRVAYVIVPEFAEVPQLLEALTR